MLCMWYYFPYFVSGGFIHHPHTHVCHPYSIKALLIYGKRVFLFSVGLDLVMQLVFGIMSVNLHN